MSAPSPSSPAAPATSPPPARRGRTLAVTSGKGGVGKTLVAANLAAALARQGQRVLVIDADLGLANLDVLLNLKPKLTLHDVFTGKAGLDEAILDAPGGFQVLLAGSGLVEYSRLSAEVREQLKTLLQTVRPRYDLILLDTGAGISDVVLYAVSLADEVLVIATSEPTSLADAYATMKVLANQQQRSRLQLLVNQCRHPGEGREVLQQLQSVLERFVPLPAGGTVRLDLVGEIPSDPSVREAVQRRKLLLRLYPGTPASVALRSAADRLLAMAMTGHN
ncbi:MAG: MinD/ParA family protein [Leptothrix sp. (in: b-proteobacteria)]